MGCVTTDHGSALILTDMIGRNLDRGCPLLVDLGGYSHDRQDLSRRGNRAFQDFAIGYLRTGDRAILARFTADEGWSRASYRVVQSWPVIAEAGRFSVRVPALTQAVGDTRRRINTRSRPEGLRRDTTSHLVGTGSGLVGLSGPEPLTSALSATGRRFAGVSGWPEDLVAGAAGRMAGCSGMLGQELLCLPRLSPFALWCL